MAQQSDADFEVDTDRAADLTVDHDRSRYRDVDNSEFYQLVGRMYDSTNSDWEQDIEKAAIEGDWVRVLYKSKRSGNIVSREGQVKRGFNPRRPNGKLYINDEKTKKELQVDKTGSVRLVNESARYGSGKKRRQNLGTVDTVKVWFSEQRRTEGPHVEIPEIRPGDHIRFEYDGTTRIEQVDDWSNGNKLIRINYPYDYEGEEVPSFIDPTGEYIEKEMDGEPSERVARADVERVETMKPEDKAVPLHDLEWEQTERSRTSVTIVGKQDDDPIVKRTFSLDTTQVCIDGEWVDADDDGYWNYEGHATPDAEALAEVADLAVEGVDTGGDDE